MGLGYACGGFLGECERFERGWIRLCVLYEFPL